MPKDVLQWPFGFEFADRVILTDRNALQMAQQALDILWGKLRRTEHDINSKYQELRAATKAKEMPELITLIKKERMWLVEKHIELQQQLSVLLAQLANAAGEGLAAA